MVLSTEFMAVDGKGGLMIEPGKHWYISARDKVIEDAVKAISKLPAHQLAELKRNFEQAEEEADWIFNHPGSRQ